MSRYRNTSIKRIKNSPEYNKKGKDAYGTTLYEKISETDDDIFIITTDGDRLDTLSQQFYGTPKLWWFIAHTNNISTNNLIPGTSLRISINTELARGL